MHPGALREEIYQSRRLPAGPGIFTPSLDVRDAGAAYFVLLVK
jgi:hypothetical protein